MQRGIGESSGRAISRKLDPRRSARRSRGGREARAVEQSNVPVTDAAVRLISVMRQFEMLQRAMAVGAEMNKRAIDEVARAS